MVPGGDAEGKGLYEGVVVVYFAVEVVEDKGLGKVKTHGHPTHLLHLLAVLQLYVLRVVDSVNQEELDELFVLSFDLNVNIGVNVFGDVQVDLFEDLPDSALHILLILVSLPLGKVKFL